MSIVTTFKIKKHITYKTFDLRKVNDPLLAYYLKKNHESGEFYEETNVKHIRRSKEYLDFSKGKTIFDLDDVLILDTEFKVIKPSFVESKNIVTFIQKNESQGKYRIILEKTQVQDYDDKFAGYKNMKQPTVIILSGYPGSGKSTLSHYFKSMKLRIIDGDKLSPQKMKDEVKKAMKLKQSMVIDGTFMTEKSRKAYIDIVKDVYDVHIIEVTTDIITSYVRNVKRSLDKKSKRTLIPLKVYRNFLKSYEPPKLKEGFSKIEHYPKKTIKGGTIRKLYNTDLDLFNLMMRKCV